MERSTVARLLRTLGWIAGLFVLAITASCGGDGEAPILPPEHPPTISNLKFTPTSALQASAATVTITGTFDFADSGGDIASLQMTTSDGGSVTTPTPQLKGLNAGTAAGQVVASLDKTGVFSFEMWVTDSMGRSSNRLSGTFEVQAPPPLPDVTEHPPTIANLTYGPSLVYQSSTPVAITGVVNFTDLGGDVVALRVVTSGGLNLTVPTQGLDGVTSGAAAATFTVAVDQLGRYTFELWAVDGRGLASNRLVGSVDVLPVQPVDHPPVIRNLTYSPSSAYQTPDGVTALGVKFDFADSAGDIVMLRVVGDAGVDVTAQPPVLTGSKAGSVSWVIPVPTQQVGVLTFEIWVVDGRGALSNRLTFAFEVLLPDDWMKVGFKPPATLYGIAWNGSRYLAVGAAGTAVTSPDLTNWTVQTTGVAHLLRSVAASPATFVAVGDSQAGEAIAMTSADGAAWTVRLRLGQCSVSGCAAPAKLSKVIWTGTQFVAVGDELLSTKETYAVILTSPDGIGWTQHAAGTIALETELLRSFSDPLMTSVAWSGTQLIAVGRDAVALDPTAWRSTAEAEVWTATAPLPPEAVWMIPLSDVTWGNGRFVIVGPPGWDGHAPTFVSTDGQNWQTGPEAAKLPPMSAVAAGAGDFVAVGDGYRQRSTDGLLWTVFPMSDCGKGVMWDGARYVAVGEAICRSP